ncbi:MAG: DNA mismatch repair protein MutS [Planctomycetota bacterium]|nr:DNA mismatch repair protein MutS [Planctomycetota bacterium]
MASDTTNPAKDAPAPNRDTPAMRQYDRFRREHPGCMLFFRMGDFYEMFYEDAVRAHKILGITLTERTSGIPMAGVPYHAAEGYLRRLVEHGERVAVCEQIQDPKDAKGVVDRAVVRVVTPGTRVDEALLESGAQNVIASIVTINATAAIALVELSTGSFRILPCDANSLADELARSAPAEIVVAEGARFSNDVPLADLARSLRVAVTSRPPWSMGAEESANILRRHYGVASVAAWGLDGASLCAAGGLLGYLLETQAGFAVDGAAGTSAGVRTLSHLEPPRIVDRSKSVILDAWTLRALEIERTSLAGTTESSLVATLSAARTPMGRRLLRDWLCFPLRDRHTIESRLGAVAALVQDQSLRDSLGSLLARIQDVARIHGRVAMRRATPRDVVALGRSLAALPTATELLEGIPAFTDSYDRLMSLSDGLAELGMRIVRSCVDDPPTHLREGGLLREGVDAELDEAKALQRDAGEWIANYQTQLIRESGIESLRTGFNRVFGYYIEVTHTHSARVPITFTRKQTLRNVERYITPELKAFEERVLTAEFRAFEREKQLFEQLLAQVSGHASEIASYGEVIAQIDCLASFADCAVRHGYVRPEITDQPILEIEQGRHPVLDRSLGGKFVPNDCTLGSVSTLSTATLALVTGPNMAGKSTFIRQNALIALMALAGSFVPAKRAVIGMCDRIFARIGAGDELHTGRSTFMVEMTETAHILHHATAQSLVVLDEIGRGTSTLDGLSLAWAITEWLAQRRTRTLFATHYHELTALADDEPAICNLQVAVREWKDEVVFLHRIEPGRADRSYGIHVAKLAGVPQKVVDRARRILETLTVQTAAPVRRKNGDDHPSLFAQHEEQMKTSTHPSLQPEQTVHPVVKEIDELSLETLTPLAAFDLLRKWKSNRES